MSLEEKWVINIREQLELGKQAEDAKSWKHRSIYRVPVQLQGHLGAANDAFSPEIISLGPYHRGKEHLSGMEQHKWRVLYKCLHRNSQTIELFLEEIKAVEEEARACYEGPVEPDSNKFVEMLVLDGCFIIELLRGIIVGFCSLGYDSDDPVFYKNSLRDILVRDVMKLENQIPGFILETLLALQYGKAIDEKQLPKLVLHALNSAWVTGKKLSDAKLKEIWKSIAQENVRSLHCLDIFRRSLLYQKNGLTPSSTKHTKQMSVSTTGKIVGSCCSRPGSKTCLHHCSLRLPLRSKKTKYAEKWEEMTYCVAKLSKSGVRFRKREADVPFWDIHFDERNGVLEIPCINVSDHTKFVLLNLIAYEQCHFNEPRDMVITDYVAFMDNLVDTATDVEHLHKSGIIVHHLGSDAEVADLFNSLVKGAFLDKSRGKLFCLYQQLSEYCSHKRHEYKADLQSEYLRNPWVIISIFFAFLLFSLTALQTIYTVYPYYRPRH